MIQICGKSLASHLKMIFEAVLNDVIFPDGWKEDDIVPVHKKGPKSYAN